MKTKRPHFLKLPLAAVKTLAWLLLASLFSSPAQAAAHYERLKSFGYGDPGSSPQAALIQGSDGVFFGTTVSGVFCGSIAWWCFLVAAVSGARHALGTRTRQLIDRIAGLALAAFGVAEIRRAV